MGYLYCIGQDLNGRCSGLQKPCGRSCRSSANHEFENDDEGDEDDDDDDNDHNDDAVEIGDYVIELSSSELWILVALICFVFSVFMMVILCRRSSKKHVV